MGVGQFDAGLLKLIRHTFQLVLHLPLGTRCILKRRIRLADVAFPADCHPVTSKRGENFMVANLKGAFGGADLEVEEDDETAEAVAA